MDIFAKGGPITWLIFFIGLICFVLVVERFLNLRRAQIDAQDFLPGVINNLRNQGAREAISICDETPGPSAHIVRAAIERRKGGKQEMMYATQEASLSELPRLERNMKALMTIVHVAPLLGLLGTVVGLIGMFRKMETKGVMNIGEMAPYIWSSLISTSAGLCVAVAGYFFYNLFRHQIDNILIDMEKSAAEIIYFLTQAPDDIASTQSLKVSPDDLKK